MKKLLPVIAPSLLALAIGAGIAYAQTGSTKSNSALTTEIGSNLPDNTTGLITPFTLRQTLLDMINSTPIGCVTAPGVTSYTLLTSDYGCLVTFNSNSAITVSLGTASVRFPFVASLNNLGTGAITLAPVAGTVNNSTSLNVGTSGAIVFSDGSNYKALLVSGSGGGGGGSTTPGGSNTQVQYNNSNAFGGISSVTTDGASLNATTATIGNITGTTGHFTNYSGSTGVFTGNLSGTTAQITGWLTAAGTNFQTGSFAGNITGSTGAQFLGQVTGTSAVFQTVTINNLTPGGPNCLQETGGVVQATNSGCSGSVSGGAPGAVALWNSASVLTNDVGITFTSPGQIALNFGTTNATLNTNPRGISIVGTWSSSGTVFDAPLFMNITNTNSANLSLLADWQVGGATIFSLDKSGNLTLNVNTPNLFYGASISIGAGAADAVMGNVINGGRGFQVRSDGYLGLSSSNPASGKPDVALFRETTGIFALANGNTLTSPTSLRVYNTIDTPNAAPTNYERGVFDWQTSTNTLTIGSQQGGTGVGRVVMFVASGTKAISLSPTINLYGQSNPGANETYAVCAGSGATSLTAGGQLFVDTTTCLASSMLVKHNIAAFNDYGMTKLASLATPLHAEHRLASAPIDIDPLAEAMALVPAVATYDTLGSDSPEFTLIAQQACQVDERLCERTRGGEVRSFKPNAVISILIAALQKQQEQIDELKRRIH